MRPIGTLLGCSISTAALACAALLPLAAEAACELKAFEIPVTLKQGRAVVHARINGTEVPMILDSGAFFSSLTGAAAAQLNLHVRSAKLETMGVTGRSEERVTRVERLGLGNEELRNFEFLVGGNAFEMGTMGLLGRNFLSTGDTEYDLANGAVRLIRPGKDCKEADLVYWARSEPIIDVPLRDTRFDSAPPIKAEARINGKPVVVMFDTGARSILWLDSAKRIGLIDDENRLGPPHFTVVGVGQGERRGWAVPIKSFELGTEKITDTKVLVGDMVDFDDIDLILGIDFFLSHRIYVARSQGRIYFTYSGGPVFDISQKPTTPVSIPVDEKSTPQDAKGLAHRAASFAMRGDTNRAMADLDRAIELAPAAAAYRAQRGQLRLQLNQLKAALADFDEALRLDSNADDARMNRATLHAKDGRADPARADLQILDGRLAPQSYYRRGMGQLYLQLHEPLLAIRQFDLWVDAHPREVDLYRALNGRCWARALANTQLDKALDDCDEAMDERPKEWTIRGSRGLVHLRMKNWDKAKADYDAALAQAQAPKNAWALWGRGLAHLGAGAREQGLADIAAAKAARPGIADDARRYGLDVPAEVAATP